MAEIRCRYAAAVDGRICGGVVVAVQDVANLVAQAGPFLGAALGAYGSRVLDKVEDQAVEASADAAAGLGRRLLRLVTGRPGGDGEDVRRAVEKAVAEPEDADRQAAVRGALKDALIGDEKLAAEIRELLTGQEGQAAVMALGERSVAAQTISGSTIVTGDVKPGR